MYVSLVVLSPGRWQGKEIRIKSPHFLIGRDPRCHLRPASRAIGTRHCALVLRNERMFVRDLAHTHGTFVNDEPVQGDVELHHEDRLQAGPLLFKVRVKTHAPQTVRSPEVLDEDAAAALLLAEDDPLDAADESITRRRG